MSRSRTWKTRNACVIWRGANLGFEPLDPEREVDLNDLPLLADADLNTQGSALRQDGLLVREERVEGQASAEPRRTGGPD